MASTIVGNRVNGHGGILMKAMVYARFGSPDELHLEEVEKPAPKDNEVLIKVHVAATTAGDWRVLRGTPFVVRLMMGPIRPKIKILGAEVAGRVEAVGVSAELGRELIRSAVDDFSQRKMLTRTPAVQGM